MQANLKGITHPCPYCEKDGRQPTPEQFALHQINHNPMSNSTQNDEIEVEGETYTKWDTQTNWKVEDRIRFLLENLIIDVGVQVTDDYKEKNGLYEGMSIENAKSRDKYTILFAELLADARKEGAILARRTNKKLVEMYIQDKGESIPSELADMALMVSRQEVIRKIMQDVALMREEDRDEGYNRACNEVLATLKEEQI